MDTKAYDEATRRATKSGDAFVRSLERLAKALEDEVAPAADGLAELHFAVGHANPRDLLYRLVGNNPARMREMAKLNAEFVKGIDIAKLRRETASSSGGSDARHKGRTR